MLFHHHSQPASGAYVEQLQIELPEWLDRGPLTLAWEALHRQHGVFRTCFQRSAGGIPTQEIHPSVAAETSWSDWRTLDPAEVEGGFAAHLQADRSRGFCLTRPPLTRLHAFLLPGQRTRLLWTFHHILLDGRSIPLVLDELLQLHDAFRDGREVVLPPRRDYADHLAWLTRRRSITDERFWSWALAEFRRPTPLPYEPNPPAQELSGEAECETRLTRSTTDQLRELARSADVTLNTVLLGAWGLLLSRHSGEADVVFGTTRACRRSGLPEAPDMIGLFINTLPFRVRVHGARTLAGWLQEVRADWLGLGDVEHSSLADIQRWSELSPGQPLFRTLFVFENHDYASGLRRLGERWAACDARIHESVGYPLNLAAYGEPELLLKLGYDRTCYSPDTAARLLGQLKRLLEVMAARPHARLADLPMLDEAELAQLSQLWQGAPVKRTANDDWQIARRADPAPFAVRHSPPPSRNRSQTRDRIRRPQSMRCAPTRASTISWRSKRPARRIWSRSRPAASA